MLKEGPMQLTAAAATGYIGLGVCIEDFEGNESTVNSSE